MAKERSVVGRSVRTGQQGSSGNLRLSGPTEKPDEFDRLRKLPGKLIQVPKSELDVRRKKS
jgi:hypothetical protein